MHAQSIVLAFALSVIGFAQQDIDNNDIPSQCSSVCSGLVQLTQTCDDSISKFILFGVQRVWMELIETQMMTTTTVFI
jgi:hypothetical protein